MTAINIHAAEVLDWHIQQMGLPLPELHPDGSGEISCTWTTADWQLTVLSEPGETFCLSRVDPTTGRRVKEHGLDCATAVRRLKLLIGGRTVTTTRPD